MRGASVGRRSPDSGVRPTINVTPLVDVVLVLLIIFMVVTPMLSRNLWLNVPPKPDENAAPPPDALGPVILSMAADGAIKVNGEVVPREALMPKLKQLIAARADKVVFFDGAQKAPYGDAVLLMDEVKKEVAQVAVLAEPLP